MDELRKWALAVVDSAEWDGAQYVVDQSALCNLADVLDKGLEAIE